MPHQSFDRSRGNTINNLCLVVLNEPWVAVLRGRQFYRRFRPHRRLRRLPQHRRQEGSRRSPGGVDRTPHQKYQIANRYITWVKWLNAPGSPTVRIFADSPTTRTRTRRVRVERTDPRCQPVHTRLVHASEKKPRGKEAFDGRDP